MFFQAFNYVTLMLSFHATGSLIVPRRSFVLLLQKEGSENLDMKHEGKIFSYNTEKGVTMRSEPVMEGFEMNGKDRIEKKEVACCTKHCGSCISRCPCACCSDKCCSKVCNTAVFCFPCLFIRKLSWPTLTALALTLAVILITMEFAADQNFCYFNPVISIIPQPLRDPYSPGKECSLRNVLQIQSSFIFICSIVLFCFFISMLCLSCFFFLSRPFYSFFFHFFPYFFLLPRFPVIIFSPIFLTHREFYRNYQAEK